MALGKRLQEILGLGESCHVRAPTMNRALEKIVLVGSLNVGKSIIFNSNYSGTKS